MLDINYILGHILFWVFVVGLMLLMFGLFAVKKVSVNVGVIIAITGIILLVYTIYKLISYIQRVGIT